MYCPEVSAMYVEDHRKLSRDRMPFYNQAKISSENLYGVANFAVSVGKIIDHH